MPLLVLEYFALIYQLSNTSLDELPSAGTSESYPLVSTLPESPEQQPDHSLPGTSESSPHVSTLPELQQQVSTLPELQQQSDLPLPGTSESSSGVFILPESLEELQELGINEESSPFSEAHSSGNGDLKGFYLFMTLIKISNE